MSGEILVLVPNVTHRVDGRSLAMILKLGISPTHWLEIIHHFSSVISLNVITYLRTLNVTCFHSNLDVRILGHNIKCNPIVQRIPVLLNNCNTTWDGHARVVVISSTTSWTRKSSAHFRFRRLEDVSSSSLKWCKPESSTFIRQRILEINQNRFN